MRGVFRILKMVSSNKKDLTTFNYLSQYYMSELLFSVVCPDSCSILLDTGNFNKVEYKVLAFCTDVKHFEDV